ncbi:MAG: hypothetical protein LJF30_10175 [Acidobacteria bacterium]|jgi:hypothetical protein|nr:hypothetical protein [Acidobacteriota bacterium]
MTGLEAPSEILLVALFENAGRAESAVESLWRRGFDSDRLSLLARESGMSVPEPDPPVPGWQRQRAVSPHLWFRFQQSARVRLPHLGFVVALGPIARELSEGPASGRGSARLPTALRRLGLSATEVPAFEEALDKRQVVLVAQVSRGEAHEWAALLQVAGARFITAHVRLDAWPYGGRRRRARRASRRSSRRHHTVT